MVYILWSLESLDDPTSDVQRPRETNDKLRDKDIFFGPVPPPPGPRPGLASSCGLFSLLDSLKCSSILELYAALLTYSTHVLSSIRVQNA